MARYPTFPTRFIDTSDEELRELYTTLETWSGLLTSELETRDVDVDAAPAAGKYKGYVSLGSETSWQDLN